MTDYALQTRFVSFELGWNDRVRIGMSSPPTRVDETDYCVGFDAADAALRDGVDLSDHEEDSAICGEAFSNAFIRMITGNDSDGLVRVGMNSKGIIVISADGPAVTDECPAVADDDDEVESFHLNDLAARYPECREFIRGMVDGTTDSFDDVRGSGEHGIDYVQGYAKGFVKQEAARSRKDTEMVS